MAWRRHRGRTRTSVIKCNQNRSNGSGVEIWHSMKSYFIAENVKYSCLARSQWKFTKMCPLALLLLVQFRKFSSQMRHQGMSGTTQILVATFHKKDDNKYWTSKFVIHGSEFFKNVNSLVQSEENPATCSPSHNLNATQVYERAKLRLHWPDVLAGRQPLGTLLESGQRRVPFTAKTLKLGVSEGPGQRPVLMMKLAPRDLSLSLRRPQLRHYGHQASTARVALPKERLDFLKTTEVRLGSAMSFQRLRETAGDHLPSSAVDKHGDLLAAVPCHRLYVANATNGLRIDAIRLTL